MAAYLNPVELDGSVPYGVGFTGLYKNSELGFFENNLLYEKRKLSPFLLEIVGGSIRKITVNELSDKEWAASLSYFPNVKTEIGFAYTLFDFGDNLSNEETWSFDVNYFITPKFEVGVNYSIFSQKDFFRSPDFKSFGAGLTYRF